MYLEQEVKYNQLLIGWNRKVNLVSRRKKNIFDLIDDSRLFLKYLPADTAKNILDLGTGGGIPGVVLAIHRPGYKFVLIDSIRKKTAALQDIVEHLCLTNVKIVCSRAEELYKEQKYKNKFDAVVARSVGELDKLVRWSEDLIKHRGYLITLKGKEAKEEIEQAKKISSVRKIEIDDLGNKQAVIIEIG